MDSFSKDFKRWMDERGLTANSFAPLINKEAGTIKQWRSRGIPSRDSVRFHVTACMAGYDSARQPVSQPVSQPVTQNLVFVLVLEKDSRNICQAAADGGQAPDEWEEGKLADLARMDVEAIAARLTNFKNSRGQT